MAKLIKRGPKWYAWIPRADGRGTRLVSTKCTDRRAAEARAATLEREAVDPGHAAASTAIVRDLLADYYASRIRLGRADGSLHHVKTKAGHLARLLPVRAAEITHATLEQYVDARLAENVRRTTIKKELRVFGGAWKLARRNRLVTRALDEIMPELDDDAAARTRWLTPWEVAGLAMVLPPERAAVIAYAVAAGCDFSALWRARREDVSSDFATARIRGSKRRTRDRVVPLPLPEQRALIAWALAHADGALMLFAPWANMRRDLKAACAKLGVAPCSPNDLRRSYGKWLRLAGIGPDLIGPAMGHADSRMAERHYARLNDAELAAQMAARTVGLLSGAPAERSDSESPAENDNPPESAENVCPGTESNRRHGDFQSESERRERSAKGGDSALTCREYVDRSAANSPTFAADLRRAFQRAAARWFARAA